MKNKIGCGKKFQIGFNKKLDCPITVQCGISEEDGKIMLCEDCMRIVDKTGGKDGVQ